MYTFVPLSSNISQAGSGHGNDPVEEKNMIDMILIEKNDGPVQCVALEVFLCCCTFNAQSIVNKLSEFHHLLYNGKFDILLITETTLFLVYQTTKVCFIYCEKTVITLVAEMFVRLSVKI